jgi:hypothetical protein
MVPISRTLICGNDQHDLIGISIPVQKKTPGQIRVAKKT